VLECVGLEDAITTAFGVVRNGGTVSRVGAPQYPAVPADFGVFLRNITLTGGVAPAHAYIEELLPDILERSEFALLGGACEQRGHCCHGGGPRDEMRDGRVQGLDGRSGGMGRHAKGPGVLGLIYSGMR
jgi:hypothetical protein